MTWAAMAALTAAALWLTTCRLSVSSDLSMLFPTGRQAAALGRFTRVFGGGDGSLVLIRAGTAEETRATAADMADALRAKPSVRAVLGQAPPVHALDPTLAWVHAGPSAREALARALTPEGMRARLSGTRSVLLAPGAAAAEEWLSRDPLRLSALPWESRRELAAGVVADADGTFQADGGKARLLVAQPLGSAFASESADRFVGEFDAAAREVGGRHPGSRIELTGGHAIAHATEAMFKRDLVLSGALSITLSSLMFVVTFRRARALVAVLPPLVVGTLWTTGLAGIWPRELAGVAVAFTAVVVGVGVDTGVHVYAALLDGRRRGLAPREAARHARAATARPTLLAAIAAGLAFASLGLSHLAALRQLGVLCGAGELLTSVAILWMTPEIGALLERGVPPRAREPGWTRRLVAWTGTRRRAAAVFAVAFAIVLAPVFGLWPKMGDAVVAIRPRGLAPLTVQDSVFSLFGGRPGQWLVVAEDATEEKAEARADAVAEALDPLVVDGTIDGYDALDAYAPALSTVRARLRARDALDLPSRVGDLRAALERAGFDATACAAALDAFRAPAPPPARASSEAAGVDWIVARHLRHDGGQALAVTYVRPSGDPARDARALAAIGAADPDAIVTGYPYLEAALRETLLHDLPRVTLVACLVVALALRGMLRRSSDVVLAISTVVVEVAAVALTMRLCHVSLHVYDALVIPVLVGVTIDESMFLLHAARKREGEGLPRAEVVAAALAEQGPLVVATALTTTGGFAALLVCRYPGLFDIGAVGSMGVLLGLVAAVVLVPAGLRLGR